MAGRAHEPHEGQHVQTLSGHSLGRVAETGRGIFLLELDQSGGLTWLRNDCIYLDEEGELTLICEAEGLHHYEALPPSAQQRPA